VARNDRRLERKQPEQVDDAVAGRHIQRKVVEAVVVDAPHERAEDLVAGGYHDTDPHLDPKLAWRL